jgi:nucleotide-binding universal stress UspA family protein
MENHQSREGIKQPLAYKKILVAIDYQSLTIEVFARAMELAQFYNSSLMICHCVKGELSGMPEMITPASMGLYGGVYWQKMLELEGEIVEETTEELKLWLRSFCREATGRGIPTEYDYLTGEPGQKICDLAKNWGADLIVLGRRGKKGFSELLLGSVSNYVLHHASCSVLVIQH